jgi:hypothetical protein
MKTTSYPFARYARVFAVLYAGLLLSSTARAQLAAGNVDNRFLLIFDTSSAMKSRVPRVQYSVERLFFSMMNGQLLPDDSIGVWSFDRELRAGEVPVQRWLPQNAATIASGITNFVARQHFSRSTHFDVVMPAVDRLVQDSQRLTVLIFCDGAGQVKGTPYDDSINSSFNQQERALKKTGEIFIVVLRAQSGQYTGYSVNSSAVGVNFPEFPPLPPPPQPMAPPQTNQPPPPAPAPVVKLAPLVIIGTNVSTNLFPPISAKSAISNPPPVKVKPSPPPPEPLSGPTNASPTNAAPSKMAGASTNTMAPPAENSGLSRQGALATGAVLLAAAALVIILALIRSRKPGRSSLITDSMNKK